MKAKTDEPKTKSKDEERFFQFAKALIAVPKKELDKELVKEQRQRKPPSRALRLVSLSLERL